MILLIAIQCLTAGFMFGLIFAGWYEDRLNEKYDALDSSQERQLK